MIRITTLILSLILLAGCSTMAPAERMAGLGIPAESIQHHTLSQVRKGRGNAFTTWVFDPQSLNFTGQFAHVVITDKELILASDSKIRQRFTLESITETEMTTRFLMESIVINFESGAELLLTPARNGALEFAEALYAARKALPEPQPL